MKNDELKKAVYDGERISPDDAVQLWSYNLPELGAMADFRRRNINNSERVGIILDRIINYTNVCEARCDFCAYHARAGTIEPYELTIDDILNKVEELTAINGTQVMLQGGLHPDYGIGRLIDMISAIKQKYPHIYLHSFSPAEILYVSKLEEISVDETLRLLQEAGLDSVPGASDLLVERIRKKVSPRKISTEEWCDVIRSLADRGMESSATMTYGMGETLEEKIEHLSVIRNIQDECSNLRAFIPWSFSPARTAMQDIIPATGVDYLKTVAVARIFLDNINYIQAGWLTEGLKLAQVALAMGANDMGGILMEETVVRATGKEISTNSEQLADIIRNAGKIPALRDSRYRTIREL